MNYEPILFMSKFDFYEYFLPTFRAIQDMIQGKKVLVNVSSLLALARHKCHRSDCHEVIISSGGSSMGHGGAFAPLNYYD